MCRGERWLVLAVNGGERWLVLAVNGGERWLVLAVCRGERLLVPQREGRFHSLIPCQTVV